ncbi:hypothetical protein [Rhabdochlamydiaceae symbiont of Dictyostelium giganteum]|uniref:hypothetical protein n=1 Tax=Rhabdochlamydiaceae symbiont of Dictyostelium giganteum TaxID=3342349 RepID=UPI00384C1E6B
MIKLLIKIAAACIFWFCVLCALTPSILLTERGKSLFSYLIQKWTPYTVTAEKIELSWTGTQSISHLTVKSLKHHVDFSIEHIDTGSSLWNILFYRDIGKLFIKAPVFHIQSSYALEQKFPVHEMGFKLPFTLKPSFEPVGSITISQGEMVYALSSQQRVRAKDITLSALLLPHQFQADVEGILQDQGAFQFQLFSYPEMAQLDITGQVEKLSLAELTFLDQLFPSYVKKIWKNIVAETYSLEMKASYYGKRVNMELKAHSPHADIWIEGTLLDRLFSLTRPAKIDYDIPQVKVKEWTGIDLEDSLKGKIVINHLLLPLLDQEAFTVQGTLQSEKISSEEVTLEPFSLEFEKDPLNSYEWKMQLDSSQFQLKGTMGFGKTLQESAFNIRASLPYHTDITIACESLRNIHITSSSQMLKATLFMGLDLQAKTVEILQNSSLTFEGLKECRGKEKLEGDSFPIPLNPCLLHFDYLPGRVFVTGKNKRGLLDDLLGKERDMHLYLDLYQKLLTVRGSLEVYQKPFDFEGNISWLKGFEGEFLCEKVPLSVMPSSINRYFSLLGDAFNVHVKGHMLEKEGEMKMCMKTPSLTASCHLILEEGFMKLKEPAFLKLERGSHVELGPLFQDHQLMSPLSMHLELEKLFFPFKLQTPAEFIKQLNYKGLLKVSDIILKDAEEMQIIPALEVDIEQDTSSDHLTFHVKSVTADGSLRCQMDLFSDTHQVVNLHCHQFPAVLLDLVRSPFSPPLLKELLGPHLDLTLSTEMQNRTGPCCVEFKTSTSQGKMKGFFHEGVLSLEEPLDFQTHLSSRASSYLLQSLDANLGVSLSSKGPIHIEIAPGGFSLPCIPLDLSRLTIEKAVCDPGQISCHGLSFLDTIFSLLKTKRPLSSNGLELWFAPWQFSLHEGVFKSERCDFLLAREFPLCVLGTWDFTHQTVEGLAGLTEKCLQRSFQMTKLPLNYILHIPFNGTFQHIHLYPKKAIKSMGQLMLWHQKKHLSKNRAGEAIEYFLEKAQAFPEGSQEFPPLKQPLPWDLMDTP